MLSAAMTQDFPSIYLDLFPPSLEECICCRDVKIETGCYGFSGGWRHSGLPQPVLVISNQSKADRGEMNNLLSESQALCHARSSGSRHGEELLSRQACINRARTITTSVSSLWNVLYCCHIRPSDTHILNQSTKNIKHSFMWIVIF